MKKLLLSILALTLSAGLWAQETETQTVSYIYPVYNTPNDPKSGIASWQTDEVEATVVESSDDVVYWGEEGQESWYVVTGTDVTLSNGAVCNGAVNIILADGAKLTATGDNTNNTPGIQVSGEGNSLTIYGQTAQSGQLFAIGALDAAGIGGGYNGSGSNITINGGTVSAIGARDAAGIGGGYKGPGSNIIINGGQVTAENGGSCAAIGGGNEGQSSNIFVASSVLLKAGVLYAEIEIPHYTGYDMADILKGKFSVKVEKGKSTAYAEGEAAGKAEAKKELLGAMGEECTDCTAVEVTDGTTTVTLYKPTKVGYIKK